MSTLTINRAKLDRLVVSSEQILEGVIHATMKETATIMRQTVHVITGKTKGSIEAHENDNTITADFGAYPEWLRENSPSRRHPEGGHDFITPAFKEGLARVPDKFMVEIELKAR